MSVYTAKRLPRQTGAAGWNAILPPQAPLPVLDRDLTADVTIIGGGFAGLSAARRLHQLDPSLKVAVLEAGRFAESSAGRNSGFMIDLPHDLASDNYAGTGLEADKAAIAMNRTAIAFAKDVAEDCALPQEMFDPVGKINAAATRAGDKHNRDFASHLERLGEPHTLYSRAEMLAITGSPHYTSGLYAPGTVMIQPAAYIRALSARLSAAISVFESSPATGFEKQDNGWAVGTPKGRISTGLHHPRQQRPSGKLRILPAPPDAHLPLCLDDGAAVTGTGQASGRHTALVGHACGPDGHLRAADLRLLWRPDPGPHLFQFSPDTRDQPNAPAQRRLGA